MKLGKKLMKDVEAGYTINAICLRHSIGRVKFYEHVEPLGYVKKPRSKCVGTRWPKSRQKWVVRNRVLYGLVLTVPKTIPEVAKAIGVSARALNSWIYEGVTPKEENIHKVCKYFNYPKSIIFYNPNIVREIK